MTEPLVIYTGSDAQPITDRIQINGRPFDLGSGSSVKFKMRHADSDQLKVDEDADIVSETTGDVKYQWTDTDLNDPGEYLAWWHVDIGAGGDLDTAEFSIIVTKHSPGLRTTTGAVYRAAKSIIPVTWGRLENWEDYGDSLLQDQIENCKLRVFNSSVSATDEKNYDRRVIDYIAKLTVLYVIPAGMDYWLSQKQSVSATGVNENASYPDRIEALEKIYEKLLREISQDRAEVEAILGTSITEFNSDFPIFSAGAEEGYITPLPSEHFPDFTFSDGFIGTGRSNQNWSW